MAPQSAIVAHAGMDGPDGLPSITIVTPSYNQAAFLERTLRSVHEQNYPKIEHLVVDGGSTDGSVDIIRRYQDRLAWWVSEKDRGQSHAINKGLTRATGDVVGWLNSDDTLAPGALLRIGRIYAACPDVDLVYGNTCLIDADDRVLRRAVSFQVGRRALIRLNRNIWCQPGTTWRRALQDRIGVLDESLHFAMDGDLWIRAARAGRILFAPFHLGNLRLHGQTKSSTQFDKFARDQQELDRRYGREWRNVWGRAAFRLLKAARIAGDRDNLAFVLGCRRGDRFDTWLRRRARRAG